MAANVGIDNGVLYANNEAERAQGIGIVYNSSTLSIIRGDGTDFSNSNPGTIELQSKTTPGQINRFEIKNNQSFIDASGTSEITGNRFGLTTLVAYTEDVPFYIYAVCNDAEDNIAFMISRVPGMSKSPVAASIGAPDDAVATDQFSFFSFNSIDEDVYDENPCLMIGSFRMQMNGSNDWTVQTLNFQDGIGRFQEGRQFTVPTGTFGAITGKHFIATSGDTPPGFTVQNYYYNILPFDGIVVLKFIQGGAPVGAIGSGTHELRMIIPFLLKSPNAWRVCSIVNGSGYFSTCAPLLTSTNQHITFGRDATSSPFTNANINNANYTFAGEISVNIKTE